MKKNFSILAMLILVLCMTGCNSQKQDRYPEKLSIYLSDEQEIKTISYSDYIVGCIFGSAEPSSGDEALKAVACAVNSYTLYQLESGDKDSFAWSKVADNGKLPYISPEKAEELYGSSYPIYLSKVQNAAEYGISHILTVGDSLFPAEICRLSTGVTESGAKCPLDELHTDFLSVAAFSENKVGKTLTTLTGISNLPQNCENWFSDAEYTKSGTLSSVLFCGARVTGEQLMSAFSLRSSAITIEFTEERFVFTCKGDGLNRGISTNTAAILSKQGMTAEEILSYFYGETELCTP